MTDIEFKAYCKGQVIRYRDRAGLKGAEQVDLDKAQFYADMLCHLHGYGKDPRSYREGFVFYQRMSFEMEKFFFAKERLILESDDSVHISDR